LWFEAHHLLQLGQPASLLRRGLHQSPECHHHTSTVKISDAIQVNGPEWIARKKKVSPAHAGRQQLRPGGAPAASPAIPRLLPLTAAVPLIRW